MLMTVVAMLPAVVLLIVSAGRTGAKERAERLHLLAADRRGRARARIGQFGLMAGSGALTRQIAARGSTRPRRTSDAALRRGHLAGVIVAERRLSA